MKAVVFHGVGDIRLDDVDEPKIEAPTDAILSVIRSAICGADRADIKPSRSVAVFGCGPVGQFAIMSANLMGAGRVIAIDTEQSRLDMARAQGAKDRRLSRPKRSHDSSSRKSRPIRRRRTRRAIYASPAMRPRRYWNGRCRR